MKQSVFSQTQEGAGAVLWLVAGFILGVGVAVAVFYLPKLNTPRQKTSHAVVRSKIPPAPVTGKIKSSPVQQPEVQTATTAAPATENAVPAMAKDQAQPSPSDEKQNATPAPVADATGPATPTSADNVVSPPSKAESQPPTLDKKQAVAAKVTPKVAAPPNSDTSSQSVQVSQDSQPPKTVKQETAVVQPLEPKPLPAEAQPPGTPAQTAAVAKPEVQTAPAAASPTPAPSPKAKTTQPLTVKAEKKLSPPASSAPYTIQFGAFRTKTYADKLIVDLQKRGYKPYLVDKTDANNQALYLVRMGRFQTRIEVVDAVARFKEKEHMPAAVVLTSTE